MQRVVLYAILSNGQVLSSWQHPQYHLTSSRLCDKLLPRLCSSSVLIKKIRCEQCWVYYFSQDEYSFVLAAVGPQREIRMKNYLKIIADIFYQLYDERKFPTILDCLMTEINRIQGSENSEDELQRLNSQSIITQKQRFTLLLQATSQRSRTCRVAVLLVAGIVLLAIYYLFRKRD